MALAAPQKCDVKALDLSLQKVVPYANVTKIGATPEALELDCVRERQGVKGLLGYADAGCFKGDALKSFKLLLAGTAAESALHCQPGTDRYAEYFKYVECSNKAGELINKCLRNATAYIEAAGAAGGSLRGPQTCCAFDCLANCLGEAVTKTCPEQPDAKDYLQGVVRGIAGSFLKAQCGTYQLGAPDCKKLPKLETAEPKYTTIYGPLLEYISSQ